MYARCVNSHADIRSAELFERAFDELVRDYDSCRFFCERDIEWTLQRTLWRDIERRGLPLAAFNQYAIAPGQWLDLAVRSHSLLAASLGATSSSAIPVGIELKYEPSHSRRDIAPSKFDVCDFNAVLRDVDRVEAWVAAGRIEEGFAVLVDEGGRFHRRPAHPLGEWRALTTGGGTTIHVHWAHVGKPTLMTAFPAPALDEQPPADGPTP